MAELKPSYVDLLPTVRTEAWGWAGDGPALNGRWVRMESKGPMGNSERTVPALPAQEPGQESWLTGRRRTDAPGRTAVDLRFSLLVNS